MSMSPQEKEVRKIMKNTIEDMTALNTYKPQFNIAIRIYSDLLQQYNFANKEFEIEGRKMKEEQTNNSGYTNERTTAIYLSIEKLRKEILNYQNALGLNPSGLKKINDEMTAKKKTSKLVKALSGNG